MTKTDRMIKTDRGQFIGPISLSRSVQLITKKRTFQFKTTGLHYHQKVNVEKLSKSKKSKKAVYSHFFLLGGGIKISQSKTTDLHQHLTKSPFLKFQDILTITFIQSMSKIIKS